MSLKQIFDKTILPNTRGRPKRKKDFTGKVFNNESASKYIQLLRINISTVISNIITQWNDKYPIFILTTDRSLIVRLESNDKLQLCEMIYGPDYWILPLPKVRTPVSFIIPYEDMLAYSKATVNLSEFDAIIKFKYDGEHLWANNSENGSAGVLNCKRHKLMHKNSRRFSVAENIDTYFETAKFIFPYYELRTILYDQLDDKRNSIVKFDILQEGIIRLSDGNRNILDSNLYYAYKTENLSWSKSCNMIGPKYNVDLLLRIFSQTDYPEFTTAILYFDRHNTLYVTYMLKNVTYLYILFKS